MKATMCLTVRVIAAAFHAAGYLSVVLQLRSLWPVCFVLLGESSWWNIPAVALAVRLYPVEQICGGSAKLALSKTMQ